MQDVSVRGWGGDGQGDFGGAGSLVVGVDDGRAEVDRSDGQVKFLVELKAGVEVEAVFGGLEDERGGGGDGVYHLGIAVVGNCGQRQGTVLFASGGRGEIEAANVDGPVDAVAYGAGRGGGVGFLCGGDADFEQDVGGGGGSVEQD